MIQSTYVCHYIYIPASMEEEGRRAWVFFFSLSYSCVCVHTRVHIHTCTHVCAHAFIHVCMSGHVCVSMFICKWVYLWCTCTCIWRPEVGIEEHLGCSSSVLKRPAVHQAQSSLIWLVSLGSLLQDSLFPSSEAGITASASSMAFGDPSSDPCAVR